METEGTALLARLAERGLKPTTYDEQVLTLHYDPENDIEVQRGHAVDVKALSQYANEVLRGLPGGDTMFPRLQEIRIEVSSTG